MSKVSNNSYDPDIEDPDDIAVTIELEDGSDLECGILGIFTVGRQDYIALVPYNDKDEMDPDSDIYLYRYFEDEDGNGSVDNIDSDEEFDAVLEKFNELVQG